MRQLAAMDETQLALFDKPYKYKWKGSLREFFTTTQKKYNVAVILGTFTTTDKQRAFVEFTSRRWTATMNTGVHVEGFNVSLGFDVGDSIELTGKGDAYRIFATVMAMLREFIAADVDKSIGEIEFYARKNKTISRARLYRRMVKKYAKDIGFKADIDDQADSTKFTLKRE